ncbi:hypothetical protein [Beijerinckia sp. L45]|uniref:hypothetical protein n=1 Tax=Beijerinckia sp. L45 TaxID=1641855 RepID=UPI00131D2AB6|nr:hypothetical protein [Beijerinckia sp. L45]
MPDRAHTLPVTRVLAHPQGGRFFRLGPSPWPEGRNNRPGKSMEEAHKETRNLVNAGHRLGSAEVIDLLHRLDHRSEAPQSSGASSVVKLARQRLLVSVALKMVKESNVEWSAATIIATKNVPLRNQLGNLHIYDEIGRRIGKVFGALPNMPAIGGLEISINEAANGWHDPRIVEHAHVIFPLSCAERVRKVLKEEFPATRGIKRPVHIQDFDGSARGLAYIFKNLTMRRIELAPDAEGKVGTRWKPLRCDERLDLALAEDRAGLDACTFARNLRIVIRDGHLHLVKTT